MLQPVQHWRFFDLVQGKNLIEDWRTSLGVEAQFKMNAELKRISKVESQLEWGARDLKGAPKKEKVFELKFLADKKQYRIAFIFEFGHQVVLLIGFYHKQNVTFPPGAINTARNRAEDYRAKRATSVERKIRLDF
jgi:phage-related protein